MKKVIIISDSHNSPNSIMKISTQLVEADYVIALGDLLDDLSLLQSLCGNNLIAVRGNCDYNTLPLENYVEIEGIKIYFCHGHKLVVKNTRQKLVEKCTIDKVDIGLYGHTHISNIEKCGKITIINPGTLKKNCDNSYCYMVVEKEKFFAKIVRF